MATSLKDKPVTIGGKTLKNAQEKIAFVGNLLVSAGFLPTTLPFYVTQVMLESAWLTSNIANKDLNISGIKQASSASGKEFQKSLGVTRGSKAGYGEGDYHAKYPNLLAWAKDYKRILSRGSEPIKAQSSSDFVERLYKNGYFTEPGYISYKKGFETTLTGIKAAISQISALNNRFNLTGGLAILIGAAFFLVISEKIISIAFLS